MEIFSAVHDFLAQLVFNGEYPSWLAQIHEIFGWTA